jgi:hypothetical protein
LKSVTVRKLPKRNVVAIDAILLVTGINRRIAAMISMTGNTDFENNSVTTFPYVVLTFWLGSLLTPTNFAAPAISNTVAIDFKIMIL